MDDAVKAVLDLMKTTFGSTFVTYYDGDPGMIPNFNLPAIIVTQPSDTTTEGQQGEDDIDDQITIKVVLNRADDYDGDNVNPTDTTERKIRNFIAARKDGKYLPNTVKGALRVKLLEGATAVAPTMNVNYGITPRPLPEDDPDRYANMTSEGHVTFSIQSSVFTYQ